MEAQKTVCVYVWLEPILKWYENQEGEMVLTSELDEEIRWNNEFSWQNNCCFSFDPPLLSFEWAGNLCVSVCLCGCQGGLWWRHSLSCPHGMVTNFACCDSHCEWGPPVGLMRKLASVISSRASLIARLIKNPLAMWETWVWSLGWEVHLEKGKATQSSVLAWRIPWGHKESDMTKRLSLWLSSVTTQ